MVAGIVLTIFALWNVPGAYGETQVEGEADALRVQVRDATVEEALAALSRRYGLRYRASMPLDRPVGGTFSGSLSRVLGRLLEGYDRVVKYTPDSLEVVIVGVSKGKASAEQKVAAPIQQSTPAQIVRNPVGPRSDLAAHASLQQMLTTAAMVQIPGSIPSTPANQSAAGGIPSPANIAAATSRAIADLEILRMSLERFRR